MMQRRPTQIQASSDSAFGVPANRTINVRLLVLTLLGLCLLGGGAWYRRTRQLGSTADVLLARADQLAEDSQHLASADCIRRYLKLCPDDVNARVRLAETYATGVSTDAQRTRAVELLYEAIGIAGEADRGQLRGRLGTMLVDLQRFTEARIEAEKWLRTDAAVAMALRIRVLALWGQYQTGVLAGNREDPSVVGRVCLAAIQANPADCEVASILAFAYREQPELLPPGQSPAEPETQSKLADQVFDALVAADPSQAKAYLFRHRYRVRYRLAGQVDDLDAALEHSTNDLATQLTAARYYARESIDAAPAEQGQATYDASTRAVGLYRSILENIDPGIEVAWIELGELYLHQSDRDAAIQCWSRGLKSVGQSCIPLNLHLADSYLQSDQLEEAQRNIDAVKQAMFDSPDDQQSATQTMLALLEANVLIKRNDCPGAIEILKRLTDDDSQQSAARSRAAMLLGQAYTALRDWEHAATAYEKVLLDRPTQLPALWSAANAWTHVSRLGQAVDRYEQIVKHTDSPEAWLALARIEYQRQVERPEALRDWTRLRGALTQLQQAKSDGSLERPWRVSRLRSNWLERDSSSKNYLTLERELRFALATEPDSAEAWNALFTFYLQRDQSDTAGELLAEFTSRSELSEAQAAFVKAQGSERLGSLEAAETEYRKAAELADDSPAVQFLAGRFLLKNGGDRPLAVRLLRRAAQLQPHNSEVKHTLAVALVSSHEEANWSEAFSLLAPRKSDSAASTDDMRLLARCLLYRGAPPQREEAARLLEDVANHSLDSHPHDRLLLARFYESQAKWREAQRQFLQLVAVPTPQADHLVDYLDFLLSHRPSQQAEPWLKKLERLEPTSLRTKVLQARMAVACRLAVDTSSIHNAATVALGEQANSGQQAKHCLDTGNAFTELSLPGHAEHWHRKLFTLVPSAFGPLALSLARQNKLAEATQLCREAGQRDKSAFPATVLAGVFAVAPVSLAEGGAQADPSGMDPMIGDALRQFPRDVDLLTAVASMLAVQGKSKQAIERYREIVRQHPDDAVSLNNLATLLSEEPHHLQEALQQVNHAISVAGAQPYLLDTLGVLLLRSDRAEDAAPVLEQAIDGNRFDFRYYLHLWTAYRRLGRDQDASQTLAFIDVEELERQVLTSSDRAFLGAMKHRLGRGGND